MEIRNFSDFYEALQTCGFSMGGGSDKGIFALIDFDWRQEIPGSPVKWHTGDRETDPWEWRMRVLEEKSDVAYAKVFFRASGYITKEWYPYFLAVRRKGKDFSKMYRDGELSRPAVRIYEAILERGALSVPELKAEGGFSKGENAAFEKALVDLQMKLLITMCGRTRKVNKRGEEYGWNSTAFTTAGDFWGGKLEKNALEISPAQAEEKIAEQVYLLNPAAEEKTVKKFIRG